VSASQCPTYSPHTEDPQGVPISAIVFGGRRASLVPLVFQARDWAHGVMVGAAMASETTAAATGAVGVVRRDPMAMKPFCGYHFGDYFNHWLSFDQPGAKLPGIFHVNWFRKDDDGRFMWPGFGENMRVLEWIIGRVAGDAPAVESAVGLLPAEGAVNMDGLEGVDFGQLFGIDAEGWKQEFDAISGYFDQLQPRVPEAVSRLARG
jgi:phosphoenolpyruvate carboxykinase (GTP)